MIDELTAIAAKHYAVTFYVAGFVGMLAHYTKKWAKGEYLGNLWAYLYADHPRATLYAVLSYVGVAAAVVSTGQLDGLKLGTLAALGFTTGYACDSAMNSTKEK